MSGPAVFNQALREVRSLGLIEEAERDFVAALDAAFPGPAELFYELAHEASLSRDELLTRCAGLYCCFAAANLADDLIDGDCDYLSNVGAIGPSVQLGLQHLGYAVLLRSAVIREGAVEHLARDLATASGAEHLEGGSWTLQRCQDVAEGLAGLQWRAYLRVLWAGSGRDDCADLGRAVGLALHLAEDIRTKDRRFYALPATDRDQLCRWGLSLVSQLRRSGSGCLAGVAASVENAFAVPP